MGKIYVLIGKSASGKDTLYARLLEDEKLSLKPFVIYTTRPKREGEQEGVEYHFSNEDELKAFEKEGKLIESRVYHTVYGDWFYFTVDDEKADFENNDYLYIGTLESFIKMKGYYGEDKVIPIYIEVEDGIRLERALNRERGRDNPGYAEMCRRFLGDEKDFSEKNIASSGITKRYDNSDGEKCFEEIKKDILAAG